jgi:hypothetical protein
MKNTSFLIAGFAVAALASCSTPAKKQALLNAEHLNNYVDSVDKVPPVYTTANWQEVNNGYKERAEKADSALASLENAEQEKVAASKVKYEKLKMSYETRINEMEAKEQQTAANSTPDYRLALRNRLFGEGKIGTDMKFGFATGANLLSIYKNFVNTVADNKNNYSREDWDEIKVLYEALDTRKNAVEKNLSGSDNMKIAGLKIKFAAIKATNRGGTKAAENEAAKN